jgi:antitoxin component of MazEF toxin-antitoxin module
MERKIVKYGNSLGVRIPSALLEALGVALDDTVEMEFDTRLKAIIIKSKSTTSSGDYLERVVRDIVDRCLSERGL